MKKNNCTITKNSLDAWIFNKDYKHPNVTPEMVSLVDLYMAPYNSIIVDAIMEVTGAQNKDNIETLVYVGRKVLQAEAQKVKDNEMIAQGWQVIPSIGSASFLIPFSYRGPVQVCASKDMDWMTAKIETTGKIVDTGEKKDAFFIPKGKRSRGYYFQCLNGYWKPI
jgi:hypothetical protein